VNASAASIARNTALVIVLLLAAVFGLIVGSVLDSRDGGLAAGAPGPFPNVWGNVADDGPAAEPPTYADPYRLHIARGETNAAADSLQTWGNVDERRSSRPSDQTSAGAALPHMGGFDGARYEDRADDAAIGPETWGNITEEQDSAGASLTAPTPR
jgi:hypothetical protein